MLKLQILSTSHVLKYRKPGRKPTKNGMTDLFKRIELLESERRDHESLNSFISQMKLEKDELQKRVSELEEQLSQLKLMVDANSSAGKLSCEQSTQLWSALLANDAPSIHHTTADASVSHSMTNTNPHASDSEHRTKSTSSAPLA